MIHKLDKKVLSWVPQEQLDPQVVEQARKISRLPFVSPHMALMPDAHLGKGATVGSVIPTDGALIPAAVGLDIGCGMIAARTSLVRGQMPDDLGGLRQEFESRIPLSAGQYNHELTPSAESRAREMEREANDRLTFYDQLSPNWRYQIGTLGSGNHFIELVADEQERVWAFLHSGSRGIGNRLGNYHIRAARRLMDRFFIDLEDPDLAYLPVGTDEMSLYVQDLFWAQKFALANREEIMDRVLDVMVGRCPSFDVEERIQCHHNFTIQERHFGRDLWITRKGAIRAQCSDLGLIPGSMGTASYVVRGLGRVPAMATAPHGAGRRFSRTEARRRLTMEDFDRTMAGIEVRRSEAFIDELPAAYKDIDLVMEQSADLVEVLHTFSQFVNVKGTGRDVTQQRRGPAATVEGGREDVVA